MVQIGIALVENEGRYLIGRRAPGRPLAGYWEFPGGKCRPRESPADCAARECHEETGLHVESQCVRTVVEHQYEHGPVQLHFVNCTLASSAKGHTPAAPFRWVAREKLPEYRFPEANTAVVSALAAEEPVPNGSSS